MKKSVYYLLTVLTVCFCLLYPTGVGSQTLDKPKLTLVMVHSYTYTNACTAPQEAGIMSRLGELSKDYDLRIRSYYMDSKVKYMTRDQKELRARDLINKIKSLPTPPDYIFTTDDAAFEYIGIPLANGTINHKAFKVLASGLNRPLKNYIVGTNAEGSVKNFLTKKGLENVAAVEENIILDKLWPILSKAHFIANRWYIIWDASETSYYMVENYNHELAKVGITDDKISRKKVSTVKELKTYIELTQKDEQGVYITAFQALADEDNKTLPKEQLAWVFTGRNLVHLELTGNPVFAQNGYSMGVGPDFEGMGKALSGYFVDSVMKHGFRPIVLSARTEVSINIKRLKELKLQSIIDENFNSIKKNYQGY